MENTSDHFSNKVAVNAITNILRTVVTAVVGLIMVPYYLGELGVAMYAVIPLATSVTTYVLIASDSLSDVVSRYLVIAIQGGNQDDAKMVYSTSIFGLLRILISVAPLILILSFMSPYVFNIGSGQALDVQLMFLMIIVSSLLLSMASCFDNVFMAYNRLYVVYLIRILQVIMQVGIIVGLFTFSDPSLIYVGIGYIISSVVLFVTVFIASRRLCPFLRFDRSSCDTHFMKEVMGLGGWSMLSSMGALMFIQASLILVNIFMGAEESGEFSIVANIISMTGTVCFSVTTIGIPLVYYHYSHSDISEVNKTLWMFTRFVGFFMVFPLAFICVFSDQLLTAWVGAQYTSLSLLVCLMVTVQVGVCSMRILESVPILYKRIRPLAIMTIILGIINIGLSVVTLTYTDWGMIGVAVVWMITMATLRFAILPGYSAWLSGQKLYHYFKPLLMCYIGFFILYGLGYLINSVYTMPSTWISILLWFFVGFFAYMLVIYKLCLNADEREAIIGFLPSFIEEKIRKQRQS